MVDEAHRCIFDTRIWTMCRITDSQSILDCLCGLLLGKPAGMTECWLLSGSLHCLLSGLLSHAGTAGLPDCGVFSAEPVLSGYINHSQYYPIHKTRVVLPGLQEYKLYQLFAACRQLKIRNPVSLAEKQLLNTKRHGTRILHRSCGLRFSQGESCCHYR